MTSVEVTVHNPMFDRTIVLSSGDELEFGRYTRGVGQLPENALLSRDHGLIVATVDGFTVTSTGRHLGFVVSDRATPSRLHIPCGVGPIEIPFANASISFTHDIPSTLDIEVVGSDRADEWRNAWRQDMKNLRPRVNRGGNLTRPAQEARFRKANGNPYTWFRTLVAMCEPSLAGGLPGVPTNTDLANRLGYTPKVIERHLRDIYTELKVPPGGRQRDAAVRIALERGIVTANDL